jgi:hypothetical protein
LYIYYILFPYLCICGVCALGEVSTQAKLNTYNFGEIILCVGCACKEKTKRADVIVVPGLSQC